MRFFAQTAFIQVKWFLPGSLTDRMGGVDWVQESVGYFFECAIAALANSISSLTFSTGVISKSCVIAIEFR